MLLLHPYFLKCPRRKRKEKNETAFLVLQAIAIRTEPARAAAERRGSSLCAPSDIRIRSISNSPSVLSLRYFFILL